jgi:hypothetical protein
MSATVLLRHKTPDGQEHFDWMIERAGSLLTFRVAGRIDEGVAVFEGERLPDHRVAYLNYEGGVSGGRGLVSRVAGGEVLIATDSPEELVVRGRLGAARGVFRGRAGAGGRWWFRFEPEKE